MKTIQYRSEFMSNKKPQIVALMIGRGGSSLKDKNILPVLGHPLLQWAAGAAVRSKHIGRYYISSDDDKILFAAGGMGYLPIKRPPELSSDAAQSCDAVRHALNIIQKQGEVDIIVVQHANVGTISEQIIDTCIEILLSDDKLTAVVPSYQCNEYHPFRAKKLEKGLLKPYFDLNSSVSANRQDLPICFFFDHSIWAIKSSAICSKNGQPPWDCMGDCIMPLETKGCLDVHSLDDLIKTKEWIMFNSIPPPSTTTKEIYE